MHASILFSALVLAATAFASPVLESRTCPNGPYEAGSSCDDNCLGALRCTDNLYDVIECDANIWVASQHCEAAVCDLGICI